MQADHVAKKHKHLFTLPAEWIESLQGVHFVGIGGAGMGGIAEVLHNLGFEVTGSDLNENAMTRRLQALGIKLYYGHNADNVMGSSVVVRSTAVPDDNIELQAARSSRIPVVPRAQMLAELMHLRHGIAIAGTHGKTTTTSLVASLLSQGGLDPTYVIGGRLLSSDAHANLGTGNYLVAEADESDASFLLLSPVLAVVTNIDAEHLETYGGSFEELIATFRNFLDRIPFYGRAVVCADDNVIKNMIAHSTRPMVTYGIDSEADVKAENIRPKNLRTEFDVSINQTYSFTVSLNLPGYHNVLNALAAIALARLVGVSHNDIKIALDNFPGIARRLESHGVINVPKKDSENVDVLLVDDYGHHPKEIAATITALSNAYPERRLCVVFQPHRYTRTRDLLEDFASVLSDVDMLVILEVYSAGEKPISGADGRTLCRAIRARAKVDPIFVEQIDGVANALKPILSEQDIVLTLGAGDVGQIPVLLKQAWMDEKQLRDVGLQI